MFTIKLTAAGLLGFVSASALAQAPAVYDPRDVTAGLTNGDRDSMPRSDKANNIDAGESTTNVAPTLPSPGLADNASSRDYLRAARAALLAGQTGSAEQALEMAETRALNMSPPLSGVSLMSDALHALGTGDIAHAIQLIDKIPAS